MENKYKFGAMVKQSNFLTSSKFDLSSLELNILFALLYEMKIQRYQGNFFIIDLAPLLELSGNQKYKLVEAGRSLTRRNYEYYKLTANNTKRLVIVNFISSVEFQDNKLICEVSENIMSEYKNLEQFTEFEVKTALVVSSKYTKRIYTMLSQFRNSKENRNDKGNPMFYIGVNDLRERLGLIDKHGKVHLPQWTEFKKTVLDVAKRQLDQENTDLTFNWGIAQKSGKKITALSFEIINKINLIPEFDKAREMLANMELAKWQIEIIINNINVSDVYQANVLYKQLNYPAGKIHNPGAYMAKYFANKFNLPELLGNTNKTENENITIPQ